VLIVEIAVHYTSEHEENNFDLGLMSDTAMLRQQREATFARPERESYHRQAILYGYGWMPTAVRI
jgi:hypothetical protein